MKMQHVTILTDKFEEEIAFYEKFAGLKIVRDLRPMTDLVFLAEENGDTKVEIIRNPEAKNSGSQFISMGFGVSDADALRKEYLEKGLSVTDLISPNPHVRFFYVTDPAGVKVQFIEG